MAKNNVFIHIDAKVDSAPYFEEVKNSDGAFLTEQRVKV
jgi:hypothetical protein